MSARMADHTVKARTVLHNFLTEPGDAIAHEVINDDVRVQREGLRDIGDMRGYRGTNTAFAVREYLKNYLQGAGEVPSQYCSVHVVLNE